MRKHPQLNYRVEAESRSPLRFIAIKNKIFHVADKNNPTVAVLSSWIEIPKGIEFYWHVELYRGIALVSEESHAIQHALLHLR